MRFVWSFLRNRAWWLLLPTLILLLGTEHAVAKEHSIDAVPVEGKKVRIDGMLREWGRLSPLSENVSGSSLGSLRVLGAVGYDQRNVYVALRIKDKRLILSGSHRAKEDHAVLALSFPKKGGGYKDYRVRLHPGNPGKSAGAVKWGSGRAISGVKIVEAPAKDGLTVEAQIPWKAFSQARLVRAGLRGALLYYDAERPGKIGAIVGTSKRRGGRMPQLTLQSEYSLNRGLVFPKGLSPKPNKVLFGNVVGDKMYERIAIYDRYLTVNGWNYRKGTEFYFQDLRVLEPGDLRRFELRDFTGDGKDDLVIQREVGDAGDKKDYFEVWHFRASNDGPQLVFQHVVGVTSGKASVRNKVAIKRKSGKLRVVVSQGKHDDDLDPGSWEALPVSGKNLYPALLPWQGIRSRTFEWKSEAFAMVDEQTGKPKMRGPKSGGRKFWSGSGPPPGYGGSGEDDGGDPASSFDDADGAPPPRPRPPTAEEKLDRVYGLYRADRGVKKRSPSFDFVTNVAGDDTAERVLIHDRDIVVFGKNFKSGSSYVYITMGIKDAKDVLDVTARDVTGDGKAEVIVRGFIHAEASKKLGGGLVARHALFIYKVRESAITRIFAAETGRSLDGQSILGHVKFLPVSRGLAIRLEPGRAIGWSQENYPFPQDRHPYAGLEPLLLPWSDMGARDYAFDGKKFTRRE